MEKPDQVAVRQAENNTGTTEAQTPENAKTLLPSGVVRLRRILIKEPKPNSIAPSSVDEYKPLFPIGQ